MCAPPYCTMCGNGVEPCLNPRSVNIVSAIDTAIHAICVHIHRGFTARGYQQELRNSLESCLVLCMPPIVSC